VRASWPRRTAVFEKKGGKKKGGKKKSR